VKERRETAWQGKKGRGGATFWTYYPLRQNGKEKEERRRERCTLVQVERGEGEGAKGVKTLVWKED